MSKPMKPPGAFTGFPTRVLYTDDERVTWADLLEKAAQRTGDANFRRAASTVLQETPPGAPEIDDDLAIADINAAMAAGAPFEEALTNVCARAGHGAKNMRKRIRKKLRTQTGL